MPRSDRPASISTEILEDLAVLRGSAEGAAPSEQERSAFRRVVELSVPLALASERRAPVVIVPGGMASSLFDVGGTYFPPRIWINPLALAMGWFFHLQLAGFTGSDHENDLMPEVKIEAGPSPLLDPLRPLYRRLINTLDAHGFTPFLFPYDWRKDMEHTDVGKRLMNAIKNLAKAYGDPVHIITHSQGASVARWALSELAKEKSGSSIGKVILLGPANQGTFIGALAVGGDLGEIPLFNGPGSLPTPPASVQSVLASFTALYQLMPWDETVVPSLTANDVRKYSFWAGCKMKIERTRLERSFPPATDPWAKGIDTGTFKDNIKVILGTGTPTPMGVELNAGNLKVVHHLDEDGDGWVPSRLACLKGSDAFEASGVAHIGLPKDRDVLRGVLDLLHGKTPTTLSPFDCSKLLP